ncbi:ParB/RepB/Spo0J family partition protein [Rudaea sp.]|uniref:ParB/RepB/Spo0J family partition protein n=1 Tax=Rudaea sp. TaxID=2136325 RepID=UPI00378517B7|nr:ParB/RepB/Spo0J family partition protein [Pseudomonadota bacterium]
MNMKLIDTLQSIPVASLVLSPLNVRKTGGQSVEDLAASIQAQGLIQNLTVTPIEGKGKFEVVAGGRRWRALRQLIQSKALPKDYAVPCRIVSAEEAKEISLSENVIRAAMHPADQFEAFKALVDAGTPIEDVAARFGVTPLVVRQRLKLANVSPALVAWFREDEITLEQMMALAVTDDHATQARVWAAAVNSWQKTPAELRAALTESDVRDSDKRAKYIGAEAYERAGGLLRRDLFSDEVYFTDAVLLDRLVEEKLARAAERVRKEGWGWVEPRAQVEYSELYTFGRLAPTRREPTKQELAKLARLEEKEVQLQEEGSAEDVSDERLEVIQTALDSLAEKREAIEDARIVDDPAARANAGALVLLGHDGKVRIERGLVRRVERTSSRRETTHAEGGENVPSKPKEKSAFSDALTRRLTAERTLALRAVLAAQPAHALTVLVHSLVLATFYHDTRSPLVVTIKDESALPRSGVDADKTKATEALHALRSELQSVLPVNAEDVWAWMTSQDQATQLCYLAYCIAPALNVMQDRASSSQTTSGRPLDAVPSLVALLGLDMADWWQASAENFFSSVSKATLLDAVREGKGNEAVYRIEKMKKADMVVAAATALDGARWLPSLLR